MLLDFVEPSKIASVIAESMSCAFRQQTATNWAASLCRRSAISRWRAKFSDLWSAKWTRFSNFWMQGQKDLLALWTRQNTTHIGFRETAENRPFKVTPSHAANFLRFWRENVRRGSKGEFENWSNVARKRTRNSINQRVTTCNYEINNVLRRMSPDTFAVW